MNTAFSLEPQDLGYLANLKSEDERITLNLGAGVLIAVTSMRGKKSQEVFYSTTVEESGSIAVDQAVLRNAYRMFCWGSNEYFDQPIVQVSLTGTGLEVLNTVTDETRSYTVEQEAA